MRDLQARLDPTSGPPPMPRQPEPVITAQSASDGLGLSVDAGLDAPEGQSALRVAMVSAAGFILQRLNHLTNPAQSGHAAVDAYKVRPSSGPLPAPGPLFPSREELVEHVSSLILDGVRPGYKLEDPGTVVDAPSPRFFIRGLIPPMIGGPIRDYFLSTFAAVKNAESVFYAYPDNHQAYLGCLRVIARSPVFSDEQRELAGRVEDSWFSNGRAMPSQVLLPYAKKVSDLFETTRPYGTTGVLYQTNHGLTFSGHSQVRDGGGHLGSLEVVPTKALLNAIDRSMTRFSGDRIFAEAVCTGNRVAILVRYSEIIGERLLAVDLDATPFQVTNPPRLPLGGTQQESS